jgi:hypothetical protein
MPRLRDDVLEELAEVSAETPLTSTARRLLAARLTIRWSQPAAAAWLGCDQKSLWNYEHGIRTPPANFQPWLDQVVEFLRLNPPPKYQREPGSPAKGGE